MTLQSSCLSICRLIAILCIGDKFHKIINGTIQRLQIRPKISVVIFSSRYILLTVRWLTFACCSNFYIFSFQCSAAEICPQRTHAASQICFSKPIVALFPLAIERTLSFIILPHCIGTGMIDQTSTSHFPYRLPLSLRI